MPDDLAGKTQRILSGVQAHLNILKEDGTEEIVLPERKSAEISQMMPALNRSQSKVAEAKETMVKVKKKYTADEKKDALLKLREKVMPCVLCQELASQRHSVVFGSGNANAQLCFVGEAPGQDEDEQGLPFVGRAGQLLTKIIESIGLSRDKVFIANVLKCRPPQNRNPQPEEIANCEPYLIAQLEIVQPKVICALGTFAARTLLKTEAPISALRGRFHDYHGIKLLPTFHPAYLLRNPDAKKIVWEDMKKIHKELAQET